MLPVAIPPWATWTVGLFNTSRFAMQVFLKIAQAGGKNFIFNIVFLKSLRPLGYCTAPALTGIFMQDLEREKMRILNCKTTWDVKLQFANRSRKSQNYFCNTRDSSTLLKFFKVSTHGRFLRGWLRYLSKSVSAEELCCNKDMFALPAMQP